MTDRQDESELSGSWTYSGPRAPDSSEPSGYQSAEPRDTDSQSGTHTEPGGAAGIASELLHGGQVGAAAKAAGGLVASALLHRLTRNAQSVDRNVSSVPSTAMQPKSKGPRNAAPSLGFSGENADVFTFQLNLAGTGSLQQHPRVLDMSAEVAMTGFGTYALAIEWPPKVPRIYYQIRQIYASWTPVKYQKTILPLEIRRVSLISIQCRWL